jgi:hypothetical protein
MMDDASLATTILTLDLADATAAGPALVPAKVYRLDHIPHPLCTC